MNEIHVKKFTKLKIAQQGLCNQADSRAQPDHLRKNLLLSVEVKSLNKVKKKVL